MSGISQWGAKNARFLHGLSETPEHRVWLGMIERCENPRHISYPRYGAKGIGVCALWRESFTDFLEDMGWRPSPRHSIDRIDNSKGYSPENCRWATAREQMRNYSGNVRLTAFGETKTVTDWASDSRCSVPFATLYARIAAYGWPADEAITTARYGRRHEHGRKPRQKSA